jgi:hypothetical protein
MPGPPSIPFDQSRPGNGASPLLERRRLLSFWCLDWRLCSWYLFALPDFLPSSHFSRTRDLWRKRVCAPKALENKRTARSPRKGIRFAQPKNDLEGNLSFRLNPPTPPFNSSLFFLSVIHVLQASQKHGQRAGRVVKPVRKFPGRKFFYGNRKQILLGKTVTLMKVTAPCPDWLHLPTCWPALRARPLCCM